MHVLLRVHHIISDNTTFHPFEVSSYYTCSLFTILAFSKSCVSLGWKEHTCTCMLVNNVYIIIIICMLRSAHAWISGRLVSNYSWLFCLAAVFVSPSSLQKDAHRLIITYDFYLGLDTAGILDV